MCGVRNCLFVDGWVALVVVRGHHNFIIIYHFYIFLQVILKVMGQEDNLYRINIFRVNLFANNMFMLQLVCYQT